ncbi:MAG TPA: GNAT family N-acetyltransferase [Thermoanaerobaculia bacterium]|nr:GNAT family N-acetyltransferase [Thermoanaerobaculia bacterium]
MQLRTDRLELTAATLALSEAELEDRAAFARILGAAVPAEWPPETAADALPLFLGWLREHPDWEGWLGWYAVRVDGSERVLVAGGGFLGAPDASGMVEMGYSVLPAFQGRGIATEMVTALAAWAFAQPAVTRIEADTDRRNAGSWALLARAGFVEIGDGREPGAARLRVERPRD